MITHLRWDELFEIANGERPPEPLTEEEQRELDGIRQTLCTIDQSWLCNGQPVSAERAKRLLRNAG